MSTLYQEYTSRSLDDGLDGSRWSDLSLDVVRPASSLPKDPSVRLDDPFPVLGLFPSHQTPPRTVRRRSVSKGVSFLGFPDLLTLQKTESSWNVIGGHSWSTGGSLLVYGWVTGRFRSRVLVLCSVSPLLEFSSYFSTEDVVPVFTRTLYLPQY